MPRAGGPKRNLPSEKTFLAFFGEPGLPDRSQRPSSCCTCRPGIGGTSSSSPQRGFCHGWWERRDLAGRPSPLIGWEGESLPLPKQIQRRGLGGGQAMCLSGGPSGKLQVSSPSSALVTVASCSWWIPASCSALDASPLRAASARWGRCGAQEGSVPAAKQVPEPLLRVSRRGEEAGACGRGGQWGGGGRGRHAGLGAKSCSLKWGVRRISSCSWEGTPPAPPSQGAAEEVPAGGCCASFLWGQLPAPSPC